MPGATHSPVRTSSTADFLCRCARAPNRFFYPCNAKDREPKSCVFTFVHSADSPAIEVKVDECAYCEGGTGWRVWPCALLLSCWLAAQVTEMELTHLRVLELGCGLGLPGLTAAVLGAAETVLSDCLPVLLRTVANSIRTNAVRARAALLDWDEEAPGTQTSEQYSTEQAIKMEQLGTLRCTTGSHEDLPYSRLDGHDRFELVLASDVVYSLQHAKQLAQVVADRLVTPAGRFVAMVPVRSEEHTRCFLCGLVSRGLRVQVTRVDRAWVEGVTASQRLAGPIVAEDWMQCSARNGRPYWHNSRTQTSVWTDPMRAAAWRSAAIGFTAETVLSEGEILFVDALSVAAEEAVSAVTSSRGKDHQHSDSGNQHFSS